MNSLPAIPSQSVADRQKLSFKILAFVATSVVLLVVFAVLAIRQQLAANAYYHSGDLKYGVRITTPGMEDIANKRRDAYIAKAKRMREEWKPWAEQHRDILARLIHATSKDYATLAAAYDAIPSLSKDAGLGKEVGFNDMGDVTDPTKQTFSYEGKPRTQHFSDPKVEATNNEILAGMNRTMKQEFDTFHDIALSRSANVGRFHIVLWASGRVTEESVIRQQIRVPGKPAWVPDTPREIAGAYDFLK